MGMFSPRSSSRLGCDCWRKPIPQGNPDPNNYKILQIFESRNFTLLWIKYYGCTNYEGKKILLFREKLVKIKAQRSIDPHFSDTKYYIHPIARFIPTKEGWQMAVKLIEELENDLTITIY